MRKLRSSLALISTFIASSVLVGCESSPTGRNQVLLFSGSEMSQLGAQSFEELKKNTKISQDPKVNRYVQCVAKSITDSIPKQSDFDAWEVVVFDSEQVNAFALPGGKIGVYTGLLNVAKTQDQLATVIGHEIAHVLAEHSNERVSQSQLTNMGLQITSVVLQTTEYSQYHDMTMGALGLGMQYGVLLPYGRTQESEADIVGLEIMSKAGYNPQASIYLWQNMAKAAGGNQPPELLSTHPSHDTRIRDLAEKIKTLPQSPTAKPRC
ncbi:M48 family metallopeptidase [Vibrio sp. SS-MA-C1-2]|uniref:M48 family metallopeptidase n=1 Tax=Vibrio sp. SS-MA-C1-2 TaxID=2908646 RepID=UPI001F26549B|nr:M48 family metallopeptidase [Vibrio sp. SS-MA-C1-2]UJF18997.1 M48 family metallopeptidase [Vibrio sp. SS-MA-C1-2]